MKKNLLLISTLLVICATYLACTKDEEGKSKRPTTIFDSTPPKPQVDQVLIDDFIVHLEQKYKRESIRNAVDLHFSDNGPGHIKVRLTYDRESNPTTANSIADAAVELAKRLKREDPELREIDIIFDRVLERRAE